MKKRFASLLMAVALLLLVVVPAQAAEVADNVRKTTTIEYLEDGSFFVIEVVQLTVTVRSNSTNGYKSATYYSGTGVKVWQIELHGYFTYNGSSATATSATASVYLYSSSAAPTDKNAYVSGASAYGSATVNYMGNVTTKSVKLTCDRNGNLS